VRSIRDRGAPARRLLARRLPRAAARAHALHLRRPGPARHGDDDAEHARELRHAVGAEPEAVEHARHHRRRGGRGLGAPPRIDARRQLAPGAMQLERVGPYLWRIPRDAERGMRVPGLVVADERLIASIRSDAALEQLANGATLP